MITCVSERGMIAREKKIMIIIIIMVIDIAMVVPLLNKTVLHYALIVGLFTTVTAVHLILLLAKKL